LFFICKVSDQGGVPNEETNDQHPTPH